MNTVYWTMQNGQKINVDAMDINHLRNTLKMIIRNKQKLISVKPTFVLNGDIAQNHFDTMQDEEYAENVDLYYEF